MRGTLVSAALLALIIVLMAVSQAALLRESEGISALAEELRGAAEAESWENAQNIMEEINKRWETGQSWIAMLIDHEEIDSVVSTLAALSQYVRYRELPELMAELETFRRLIEHIPRKESAELQNIL